MVVSLSPAFQGAIGGQGEEHAVKSTGLSKKLMILAWAPRWTFYIDESRTLTAGS